jgi:transaldolase
MTTPQATSSPFADLSAAGVSMWLDDLSRQRLQSGNLKGLIADSNIVGVTTNPSIFLAALKTAPPTSSRSVNSPPAAPTSSIEVDPRLAHDTAATIAQAQERSKIVDRPNLLIKIPATIAGLPAMTAVSAEGISVNVTLIFSLDRYKAVMAAYDDTRYVVELVAPNTMNTAPEKTIDAVRDHCVIRGNTIEGTYARPSRSSPPSRPSGSTSPMSSRSWKPRASKNSSRPGTNCWNP